MPTDIPIEWLSCAFQWYAVSTYNYARLVGWLTYKDAKQAKDYANKVLPRISKYRHKVAAHFAITDPWNEDNEADLQASITTNIVYVNDGLRAGAMSEIITDSKGNEIEPSYKLSWSLTKAHNKLIPRYWPSGPINVQNSIKLPAKATRKFSIDKSDK